MKARKKEILIIMQILSSLCCKWVCSCSHIDPMPQCLRLCVYVCVCVNAWSAHLQSVRPHEFLCGSSSSGRYGDAGVAGDHDGATGQDVSVHQAGRHRTKVRVKRSSSSVDVGCEAGCDWKHGLWGKRVGVKERVGPNWTKLSWHT